MRISGAAASPGTAAQVVIGRLIDRDAKPGHGARHRAHRTDDEGSAPHMLSGQVADDGYSDDAAQIAAGIHCPAHGMVSPRPTVIAAPQNAPSLSSTAAKHSARPATAQ